jgi:hypothetical protein
MKSFLSSFVSKDTSGDEELSLYPKSYVIQGAGAIEVNGKYVIGGFFNNRPYYTHTDSDVSLWYFHTDVFPLTYFCGWYISKYVSTICKTIPNNQRHTNNIISQS